MKKTTFLLSFVFLSVFAFGQYYYLPASPGNPNNINQEDAEYPNGSGLPSGWTSILGGSQSSPAWSASQTIPFTFNFNGGAVSSFRASSTGVVTFASNPGTAPGSSNSALPSSSVPDSSVCVWGITGSGSSDQIMTKTFGTSPNRQLWIFYTSYTIPGNASSWTYWSVVLEETSNNIYVVDQRTGNATTALTVGVQVDGSTYTQVAASPSVANLAGTDPTRADNWHYTFIQGTQPAYDMEGMSVDMADFLILNQAPFDVEGTFRNLGTTTITDADFNYSINNASVVNSTVSSLNIATFASGNLATTTKWTPATTGVFEVKIWASDLNGSNSDQNTSNDTATKIVTVVNNYSQRIPLYETFTSSTCPPCVPANTNMEQLFANNPGKYTSLKYQMSWPGSGDPYYTAEGGVRRTYYSVNSVPNVAIDGGWNNNGNSLTQQIMDSYYAIPAFMTISADYSVWGQTVQCHITINPLNDFPSSQNTLHMAIYEKETTQNVATNGETEFFHVMKKMVPDANGTSVGALTANQSKNYTLSYTFKGNFRKPNNAGDPINHATEHSVEEFSDLGVIVWVQDDANKQIHQSVDASVAVGIEEMENVLDFSLFPNPAKDAFKLRYNGEDRTFNVDIVNMIGQNVFSDSYTGINKGETITFNVSDFEPGIYFVNVSSNGMSHTKKITIQ